MRQQRYKFVQKRASGHQSRRFWHVEECNVDALAKVVANLLSGKWEFAYKGSNNRYSTSDYSFQKSTIKRINRLTYEIKGYEDTHARIIKARINPDGEISVYVPEVKETLTLPSQAPIIITWQAENWYLYMTSRSRLDGERCIFCSPFIDNDKAYANKK